MPELGFHGYIPVEVGEYFYWGFYSHTDTWKTDPLIIYLPEGLGEAILLPIFSGNGPFTVDQFAKVKSNPAGWNRAANLLYIDVPAGSGLSIRKKKYKTKMINYSEESVFVIDFLNKFFAKHKEFAFSDLILSGESGGGGMAIVLTSTILRLNPWPMGQHKILGVFAQSPLICMKAGLAFMPRSL